MSAKSAYDYHMKNWSDIQGHLPLLRESAVGNCMEIGVRFGVSTSALLSGLEDNGGHLYSFDISDCPVFLGHPQWTFRQIDTVHKAEEVKRSIPEKLALLFVDGDHTYEGALADLMNFGPRASRIFVHDTDAPNFPGVKRAVDEFVAATHRTAQFHRGSFGMAEIV